jgi:hypothetical protein
MAVSCPALEAVRQHRDFVGGAPETGDIGVHDEIMAE